MIRRGCQQWILRTAYRRAERVVLNVPLDRVGWLPVDAAKAECIPVGANVPVAAGGVPGAEHHGKTVAVFGVTGGDSGRREVDEIGRAVQSAAEAVPDLRLIVLGRGSKETEAALRKAVNGTRVDVSVLGLLPAEDVSGVLAGADVLLFVRGPLSSQRTSGIAGIACGLPLVGYAGPYTGPPVTEAGVVLVPWGDHAALASALRGVLADDALREHLRGRSLRAYRRYFSWDAIAGRYVEALRL
jgi:glycosyltransferase involved in cell wall biosynthesis